MLREARGPVSAAGREAGGTLRVEWDQLDGPMTARAARTSRRRSPGPIVGPPTTLRASSRESAAVGGDRAWRLRPTASWSAACRRRRICSGTPGVVPLGGGSAPAPGPDRRQPRLGGRGRRAVDDDRQRGRPRERRLRDPALPVGRVAIRAAARGAAPDFAAECAVADGGGGQPLLVGSERLADGAVHLSVFALAAGGNARRLACDTSADSPIILNAALAAGALRRGPVLPERSADDRGDAPPLGRE